jgi:hypothetical protein
MLENIPFFPIPNISAEEAFNDYAQYRISYTCVFWIFEIKYEG